MYDVDTVLESYIKTALWSSYDESDDNGGHPMDENYSPGDLADETVKAMRADVEDFLRCIELEDPDVFDAMEGTVWEDPGQVGHDFWLTRNGHGAGFWDRYSDVPRGAQELGAFLTRWSKHYGSADLYVGDDGKIYQQ